MSETIRRIGAVSGDSPRQWGNMTVGQMVCHLADSFEVANGERPAGEVSSGWSRTVMKWGALYAPMEWPKGVPTVPEVDADRGGTRPTALPTDVERLEATLLTFVEVATAGRCGRHPFFGAMSPSQWLRWGYLHADHHLRQFGV